MLDIISEENMVKRDEAIRLMEKRKIALRQRQIEELSKNLDSLKREDDFEDDEDDDDTPICYYLASVGTDRDYPGMIAVSHGDCVHYIRNDQARDIAKMILALVGDN